ncbi:unnamed protein product [Caenorhabditis sp. 36 PRJEB53466]|nr:unnamed protein product [Caenorhabditis sp. 36 PRJEB53466]
MLMAHFSLFSSSLSTFVIIIILIFTIANYYQLVSTLKDLDKRLVETDVFGANRAPQLYPLFEQFPIRELRRNALLMAESVRAEVLKHAVGKDNRNFYTKLKPEAFCEKTERIGEKGDGGKVVCNPSVVRDDCTLMSLGLNNQVGFDQAIYKITGEKCKLIGADKDPQNMNTARAYSAMGGRLFSGKIPDEITIPEMLVQAHRKQIEVLKIDIEGDERTGLEPLLKDTYVCQILIEIHGWPPEHLEMLQKIARYGFRLYNIEENYLCSRCCEYSFINELCMLQFGVVPLAITIPHNITNG